MIGTLRRAIQAVVPGQFFHPRYGVKTTLTTPSVCRGHLRQSLFIPINDNINRMLSDDEGMDIMAADWDTLVLLDACRYDSFAARNTLPGSLSRVRSPGPKTRLFLQAAFADRKLHDTVYVTANPQHASLLDDQTFHAIVPVWQDAWDDKLGTVYPDPVTDAAIAAADEYPNKRLVVHYLQPHQPFIGPRGRRFMHDRGLQGMGFNRDGSDDLDLYPALNYGLLDLSDEELYGYYEENIDAVLSSVERLVSDIDGKTVVTSDHGEFLGDRAGPIPVRNYGHAKTYHTPVLLDVPWLELPFEDRPSITAEPPAGDLTVESSVVKERLSALGYR